MWQIRIFPTAQIVLEVISEFDEAHLNTILSFNFIHIFCYLKHTQHVRKLDSNSSKAGEVNISYDEMFYAATLFGCLSYHLKLKIVSPERNQG
jgi:hypothetical protein